MKNSGFKKIMSLLLAVLMTLGVFPVSVFAETTPVVTAAADKTEAKIGDTVEITFTIENNPGFTNIELMLDFNKNVLKFTGLKNDPDTESYVGRFGGGATVVNTDTKNEKYGFVTNARSSLTETDGRLFVAVFEVIGSGEISVTADILAFKIVDDNGNSVEHTVSVTPSEKIVISAPEEGSISFNEKSFFLKTGEKTKLNLNVVPGSETNNTVLWSSSDENIVTVDGEGTVTAVSPGNAVIKAQCGTLYAECGVTIKDPLPYLSNLYLSESSYVNNEGTAYEYPMTQSFEGKTTSYIALAQDNYSRAFAWAKLSEDAPKNSKITAKWVDKDGNSQTAEIPSGINVGTYLTNFVTAGITGNTVDFEVGTEGDIQTYSFEVKRTPTLAGLSVSGKEGKEVRFNESFGIDVLEYSAQTSAEEITVSAVPFNEGYSVTYNGNHSGKIVLSEGENLVEVKVKNAEGYERTYKINVKKVSDINVAFKTSPENALVFVTDKFNRRVWPDENGVFKILAGESYHYSVTALGYAGKSEEFTASLDKEIPVSLEKSKITVFKSFDSSWPSFGFNSENNIVIDRPTPLTKEETALYWANKIGEGYDYGATGVPILVGDYLYCYSGKTIMKIDKMSGKIIQTGVMTGGSSAYAICSLTYAEGLVFVGLNNGVVQAFNAETLESVWIYHDPLKGQPNAQITYSDGFVYTGFWNSETRDANFVCLSVTDEDPSDPDEEKIAAWAHTQKGGFYWAGAYISGDYLYLGTDDGESGYGTGYAHLLSINKHNGKVVDDVTMPNVGDIRSSITFSDGKLYFTSKGGYFYEAEFDSKTGDIKNIRWIALENGSNGVAMSTSTPTVYNGRAYIGVSGKGQFVPYSGHNITVIDIESWSIAYSVPTQGYPQTTGTLTTYYEEETGYVYVYFFDNFTPGRLRILEDKPGMTEPSKTINEVSNGASHTVGYSVFEPFGPLAQYCICTPIIDEDGTLYFKNDSAYLFAVGSAVEYIEVTKQPDKTTYKPGDVFDPKGMEVTAYYYNGTKRDVTDYITYSTDPLEKGDNKVMIIYENVGSDEKPYDIVEISVKTGFVELEPEKETKKTKIRLNDTVKFDNTIDTPETFFANKSAGGNFYVAILSDIKYDKLEVETTGYLKSQLVEFDPEKYYSVGEKYTVYHKITGEIPEKGFSLTYEKAKKLAEELNNETKTTLYEVKCDCFVYVAKIAVPQNYGVSYSSGTYRFIAEKDGKKYASAEHTIVSDVSIFEYEYLKWAAKNDRVLVASEEARGYSDYLTDKYGYGLPEYAPAEKELPTVISTTGFRAIADKKLLVACGEGVEIEIPKVSGIQRGINFEYKNTVGELDSEKKVTTYSLTFYGKQPVQSDFVIRWNLGQSFYDLRESFKVKVEEEDIVTFYITKDGKYFDEVTVDFMKDDIDKDVVLSFENKAGSTLGVYRITTKRPADADSADAETEEVNPNTGAMIF